MDGVRKSEDGIQARRSNDGSLSYRVQVRLRGFPAQSATFVRRTDAKKWKTQTEAALREGRYFPIQEAKRHTLTELVDRYLETVQRRRPHALAKERQRLGWWKEQLGAYALASITPALIAKKRDELLAENICTKEAPERRAPATANRYMAALGKALTDAVREYHWLHDNPMRRVTKETEPQGRVRYLSDAERSRLLEACEHSSQKELELIVLLALTTGMRKGEILGLRWADVDLKRRQVVLHKTKNGERRGVVLVPQVLELLEKHATVRRLDTDLVFPQATQDKPIDPSHAFQAALAKAKITDFRFHDLRHTTASYLAMSGATTAEIAAVLGHKTLAMVKRYAHLSDQHSGAVVGRMAEKYFAST